MSPSLIFEIVGWVGSAQVVAAYALISLRKVTADSLIYQVFNFVGSAMLIAFTIYKRAYPPATVNTIWAVIALISLSQMAFRRLTKKTTDSEVSAKS